MNQIFLLPLIGLLTLSSAQAADGMFVFNDAESFVVARSYKLGEADGGSDGGRTLPVLKKSALGLQRRQMRYTQSMRNG